MTCHTYLSVPSFFFSSAPARIAHRFYLRSNAQVFSHPCRRHPLTVQPHHVFTGRAPLFLCRLVRNVPAGCPPRTPVQASCSSHTARVWSAFGSCLVCSLAVFCPCLVCVWSAFGPRLVRVWSVFVSCLVRVWSVFGPCFACVWSAFRPRLVRVWSAFSPCLLSFWSALSSCLARVWPAFGPCLFHVWPAIGRRLARALPLFHQRLVRVWPVFSPCLARVWRDHVRLANAHRLTPDHKVLPVRRHRPPRPPPPPPLTAVNKPSAFSQRLPAAQDKRSGIRNADSAQCAQ